MTRIIFVINPIAGDIEKEEMEDDVRIFCSEQRFEFEILRTTGQEDEQRLEARIDQFKPEIVAALGGDGTVSLVAKMLIDTPIALAIIPLGSGNGLSKDLEIPQDFSEALHMLKNFKVKAIDTLCVNNQVSIHLCDMGFNALVVKGFHESQTRGAGTYAWIALQEFMGYEPKSYTVQINGEIVFEGEAFMLTVTNAKAFGSNASFNPHGVINDGFFEIFILKPFPKTSSLALLYQMYTENIDDSEYTLRFSCQEAIILNHNLEAVHIDGEPVLLPKEIHFKVSPESLQVVLPLENTEEEY